RAETAGLSRTARGDRDGVLRAVYGRSFPSRPVGRRPTRVGAQGRTCNRARRPPAASELAESEQPSVRPAFPFWHSPNVLSPDLREKALTSSGRFRRISFIAVPEKARRRCDASNAMSWIRQSSLAEEALYSSGNLFGIRQHGL